MALLPRDDWMTGVNVQLIRHIGAHLPPENHTHLLKHHNIIVYHILHLVLGHPAGAPLGIQRIRFDKYLQL